MNISKLIVCSSWEIDAPDPLALDDVEVCKLLSPYLLAAVTPIERADLLVRRIEIRPGPPGYVRAYTNLDEEPDSTWKWPTFCQKDLPPGLYEALVDLSKGPHHPFKSDPAMNAHVEFHTRVQALFFPEKNGPKAVVMRAENYADFRFLFPARLDLCTSKAPMVKGFQGTFYERGGDPMDDTFGRAVQMWIHQDVPMNHVVMLDYELPLDHHPMWAVEPVYLKTPGVSEFKTEFPTSVLRRNKADPRHPTNPGPDK